MAYIPIQPLTREQVEELAEKDGPTSNAAMALFEAALHDGEVKFFKRGVTIIVERR